MKDHDPVLPILRWHRANVGSAFALLTATLSRLQPRLPGPDLALAEATFTLLEGSITELESLISELGAPTGADGPLIGETLQLSLTGSRELQVWSNARYGGLTGTSDLTWASVRHSVGCSCAALGGRPCDTPSGWHYTRRDRIVSLWRSGALTGLDALRRDLHSR